MNKKWWIFSALAALPVVLADLSSISSNVWTSILSVGNLSWLGMSDGGIVVAFTRILLGLLAFTLFFALITVFGGGKGDVKRAPISFFNRSQAMIVAAILGVMTAVFLPAEVILAVGAGWATAMAFILLFGPVAGVGYFLWSFPFNGQPDTKGTLFLKFILCVLLFWILSAMNYHLTRLW
ncbi:MAG: hypothetical protein AABX04_06115 [Nanoarchaeota archaeon]